ncbi:MAG: hypothetical protein ACK55Z_36475, partial [bacterium]
QLAGKGQPHTDEVAIPSTLHREGNNLNQAQGLAAESRTRGSPLLYDGGPIGGVYRSRMAIC